MMFLDCPAYLPEDGTARCGLPAEPRCRFTMRSTDGPLESAMITCPAGHWFNGPIEFLIWESRKEHEPGSARVATSARRDSRTGGHDGLDGSGGFVARDSPGEPGRALSRLNDAPAYYLRRPARVWITAMSPRRRRTASHAWSSQARPTPGACGLSDPGRCRYPKGSPTSAPRTARPTRPLPIDWRLAVDMPGIFPDEFEANAESPEGPGPSD